MPVLTKNPGWSTSADCRDTHLHSETHMRLCGEPTTVSSGERSKKGINNACYTGTIENDCNRAHPGFHYTLLYYAKYYHYCHSVSDCDYHRPGDFGYWVVNAEAGSGGGRRPAGNSSKEIVIFFFFEQRGSKAV
jgi:hypothetical protein